MPTPTGSTSSPLYFRCKKNPTEPFFSRTIQSGFSKTFYLFMKFWRIGISFSHTPFAKTLDFTVFSLFV